MKKLSFHLVMMLSGIVMMCMFTGCDKEAPTDQDFNLDVPLRGGKSFGYIKFRQDPDPAKIIDLGIRVRNLAPNNQYLLQRAVDESNVVDGNCTSTSWLTLGKGRTPHAIMTNARGEGEEELWRDITAIPSGSRFDIHFQVVDAVTLAVVLTSDCYHYTVR